MPLVVKDRVRETSTTAGTGTFTLAGAVLGYQSFSAIGDGNTTYYTIYLQGGNEWEVGIGTYTASGTTLSRDTILSSSNAGSAVNFSAGVKDVFVTYPAGRSVWYDSATNVTLNALTVTGALAANGGTTIGDAAGDAFTINSSAVSTPNGLNFDSNTLVVNAANDRVGIGVASPAYKLDIEGTVRIGTGGSIQPILSRSGTSGGLIINTTAASAAGPLAVQDNSVDRLVIDQLGNVLIGTATNTNSSKLVASGTISETVSSTQYLVASQFDIGTAANEIPLNQYLGNLAYQDAGSIAGQVGLSAGTAALPSLVSATDTDTGMWFPAANTLAWSTGGTQAVTINSSQNVGIGTDSPATYSLAPNLVVQATTSGGVTVRSATTGYGGIYFADGTTGNEQYRGFIQYNHGFSSPNDALLFGTAGNTRITLDSSGNLGLGVTPTTVSNNKNLEIGGSVNAALILSTTSLNAAARNLAIASNFSSFGDLVFLQSNAVGGNPLTAGTQRMTLDASGRLGVGATNPDSMVEINSATAAYARFKINYNSSALAYFGSYSGIVGSGNATDTMLSSQAVLAFGAGGTTERARISSDGTFRVKGAGSAGSTDAVQFSGSAPANSLILDSSGVLKENGYAVVSQADIGTAPNEVPLNQYLGTMAYQDGTNYFNTVSTVAFRNRIINGGMGIDQRNAGASFTPTDGAYGLDRYLMSQSPASKYTCQQNAGGVSPPPGFTNYMGFTSTSAYSLGSFDFFGFQQRIEGVNAQDFAWNTSAGKTVTLSFWVRSSLTGPFGGSVRTGDFSASYVFRYTINTANTWEYKTVTIPAPTTGSVNTGTGQYCNVVFAIACGSGYTAQPGSWQALTGLAPPDQTNLVGTNGATFYITGIQLELGTQATPFDWRPFTTELELCYRYCLVDTNEGSSYVTFGIGNASSSTAFAVRRFLPVTMRSGPTVTLNAGATFLADQGNVAPTVTSLAGGLVTTKVVVLTGTVASGMTAGSCICLVSDASTSLRSITYSAEL